MALGIGAGIAIGIDAAEAIPMPTLERLRYTAIHGFGYVQRFAMDYPS
jgi:hypothetical protein